jgi:hypothetical protein
MSHDIMLTADEFAIVVDYVNGVIGLKELVTKVAASAATKEERLQSLERVRAAVRALLRSSNK